MFASNARGNRFPSHAQPLSTSYSYGYRGKEEEYSDSNMLMWNQDLRVLVPALPLQP